MFDEGGHIRQNKTKSPRKKKVIFREHSSRKLLIEKQVRRAALAAQRWMAGEPMARPGAPFPRSEISQFLTARSLFKAIKVGCFPSRLCLTGSDSWASFLVEGEPTLRNVRY